MLRSALTYVPYVIYPAYVCNCASLAKCQASRQYFSYRIVPQVIQEVAAHSRQVQAIRFSPNNRTIVSCGSDFKVKVIDIVYGTVVFSKCEHNLRNFFLGGGGMERRRWEVGSERANKLSWPLRMTASAHI